MIKRLQVNTQTPGVKASYLLHILAHLFLQSLYTRSASFFAAFCAAWTFFLASSNALEACFEKDSRAAMTPCFIELVCNLARNE